VEEVLPALQRAQAAQRNEVMPREIVLRVGMAMPREIAGLGV